MSMILWLKLVRIVSKIHSSILIFCFRWSNTRAIPKIRNPIPTLFSAKKSMQRNDFMKLDFLGKVLKALALSYGYHNGCVWSSLELSGGRFLNPVAYRVNCTLGYTSDSDAKYEIFFKKEFKIDKGEIKDYVASITTQSEYDNVKRKLMDYFKRFTLAGKKRKRRQTDRQKVAVSASYMMKMNLDEGAVRNAYDQARTSHERDLENRISPRAWWRCSGCKVWILVWTLSTWGIFMGHMGNATQAAVNRCDSINLSR